LVSRYEGAKQDYKSNKNHAFYDVAGTENRIPSKDIKEFEDAMDGEYVPFYFQDLRTNEMLVFHAFLLSISDDYSASYESISGLGRAEPVRVYKETQRKLGLSFMLAATDIDDFDHMWDKINRLTMLVYPQYTAGKTYTNPGTTPAVTFQKPFTQQIAAGPMVRMRLGNLFRSNYSIQALAKMFGLNSNKAVLPSSGADKSIQITTEKLDSAAAEARYDADTKNRYNTDFKYKIVLQDSYNAPKTLDPKTAAAYKISAPPPAAPPPASPTPPPASPAAAGAPNPELEFYPVDAGTQSLPIYFQIEKTFTKDGDTQITLVQGKFKTYSTATDAQKTQYNNDKTSFYIPTSLLQLDEESKKKYAQAKQENADVKEAKAAGLALTEFMLPANNAIVRSFESTSGKGIAGFIDSLSFDWYDKVTWDTTDIERKAPKMCKVTIAFTPVHDIAPGLDSEGYNRAPIYPLGPYRHGIRKVP